MTFELPKLQGKISCACTCTPRDGDSTVKTTMPAQLTVFGYILGDVWPPHSLFNKFRRLCHRNEAHHTLASQDTTVGLNTIKDGSE